MELKAYGTSMSVTEWARELGMRREQLYTRLRRYRGLPPEVVLALPTCVHLDPGAKPGEPRSWTWDLLEWEDDPGAQAFLAQHPGGATLEEVAAALGVTRERVRQIEEIAMRKCRREAERLGVEASAIFGSLDELRDKRAQVTP